LDRFAEWLSDPESPPQCLRMLRLAAVGHVTGRSGEDLVILLHRIGDRRDTRRAALLVAQNLRGRALAGDVAPSVIVDYLRGLRQSDGPDDPEAVSWVLKTLSEPEQAGEVVDGRPAAPGRPADRRLAKLIANVGAGLYDAGLSADGWKLLERWLENEQRVDPGDVAVVFSRLVRSAMSEDTRRLLMRSTVGRWSDVHGRTEASYALRSAALAAEADLSLAGH
jgi:hypothetical protein